MVNSITLPNTDGTAGQVLTTDGTGNVSFQNAPSFFNNMQGGTAAVGSSGGANFKSHNHLPYPIFYHTNHCWDGGL